MKKTQIAKVNAQGMLEVDISFDFDPSKMDRFTKGDRIGFFMAETFARYMSKYIPVETGMLRETHETEPYRITYTQPYARHQYYGDHLHFNKEMNPNATSRWDKAVAANDSRKVAAELTDFIRAGAI